MEEMDEGKIDLFAHLRSVKFRKIYLPNPTSEPADTSIKTDNPFITIPDFSARYPWQISTAAAFEFLRHLPLISLSTLPEDSRACDICYEPYESGNQAEKPTKLPCHHILGRRCIGKWLLPQNAPPKNSCPVCRSNLFSEESFIVPLTSAFVEGDAGEWVRETTLFYQGDPNAEEAIELLAQEMERVSSKDRRLSMVMTAEFLQGLTIDIDTVVRQFQSRFPGIIAQQRLLREALELLSPADQAALEELSGSVTALVEGSRGLRTLAQDFIEESQSGGQVNSDDEILD